MDVSHRRNTCTVSVQVTPYHMMAVVASTNVPSWHENLYATLTRNFGAFTCESLHSRCYITQPNAQDYKRHKEEFVSQWDALPTMDASKLVRELASGDVTGLNFILLTLDVDDVPCAYLYPGDTRRKNVKLYAKGVVPISSLLGIADDGQNSSHTTRLGKCMDLEWLKHDGTRIVVAPNTSTKSTTHLFTSLFHQTKLAFDKSSVDDMADKHVYAQVLQALNALFRYANIVQHDEHTMPRVFRLVTPVALEPWTDAPSDSTNSVPNAKRSKRDTDALDASPCQKNMVLPLYSWVDFARDFTAFAPSYDKARVFQVPPVPDLLRRQVVAKYAKPYHGKRIHELRWAEDVAPSLMPDLMTTQDKDMVRVLEAWWPEIVAIHETDDRDNESPGDDVTRSTLITRISEILEAHKNTLPSKLGTVMAMYHNRDTWTQLENWCIVLGILLKSQISDASTTLPPLDTLTITQIHRWLRHAMTKLESFHEWQIRDELDMLHTSRLAEFPIWICASRDLRFDDRRQALIDVAHIDDVLNVDATYTDWAAFVTQECLAEERKKLLSPEDNGEAPGWAPKHYLAMETSDSGDFMAAIQKDDKLATVLDFVDDAVHHGRHLVIHCRAGQHRSVATLMLWLLLRQQWDVGKIFEAMLRLNRLVVLMPSTILWMLRWAQAHDITPSTSIVYVACSPFHRRDESPVQQVFDTARAVEAAKHPTHIITALGAHGTMNTPI